MGKHIKRPRKSKISSKTVKSPNIPKVRAHNVAEITHPLFNFAYISTKNKYGLKTAKKHTRFEYNLLSKLTKLSAEKDLANCIALNKDLGIEPLHKSEVKPSANPKFRNSSVYKYCKPSYYAFRTSEQGRVIGCIWQNMNIFYVLFLDPDHDAYNG